MMASSGVLEEKDQEIRVLKSKLEMAEEFVDQLRKSLRDTEDQLQEARREKHTVSISKEAIRSDLEGLKAMNRHIEQEKSLLTSLLDRRVQDNKILETEVATLRQRLATATEANLDSSLQMESFELRETSLRQKEARLEQESQVKDQRLQVLEQELDRVVKELSKVRSERSAAITDLEVKLNQKGGELSRCREEIAHLKTMQDVQKNHTVVLENKLKEQHEGFENVQRSFNNEIEASNNLIQVQKKLVADERKKNQLLISSVEDMNQLLVKAKEAQDQLVEKYKKTAEEFNEKLASRDSIIDGLVQEIESLKQEVSQHSKEQTEQELQAYFPAASSASLLLRDRDSLTGMEVSQLQEQLEVERSEKERLKMELQRVVQEAEERAPLIHGKMIEHKNAMQLVAEMQNHLTRLNAEKEEWDEEKDTLVQLNTSSQREVMRFRQENQDLSRQVQRLLMTVNELTGKSLVNQIEEVSSSYLHQTSGNHVISQHLVTFRDVQELQQQNQKLLAALRDLTEKMDEIEQQADDEKSVVKPHGDDLQRALNEIESLRLERKAQSQKYDALIKQRDALQVLATTLSPSEAVKDRSSSALDSSLQDKVDFFQSRFEKLDNEFSKYRDQAEGRFQELTSNLLQAKDEVVNARVNKSEAESKVSHLESHLQEAKRIMEETRTAYESVRTQLERISKDYKKVGQENKKLKDSLESTTVEMQRLQSQLNLAVGEKDRLAVKERTLMAEMDVLRRELVSMSHLGETTKTLNSYIEKMKTEDEKHAKDSRMVQTLRVENADLMAKMQQLTSQHESNLGEKDVEIRELNVSIASLNDEVANIQRQNAVWKTRCENLQKKLNIMRTTVKPDLSPRVTELESALKVKTDEASQLASQLELKTASETQLQTQLKQQTDEVSRLNNELAAKTAKEAAISEQHERNKRVFQTFKNRNGELITANTALKTELDEQKQAVGQLKQINEQLGMEITTLKTSLDETNKKLSEAAAPQDVVMEVIPDNSIFEAEKQAMTKEITDLKTDLATKEDRLKKLASQAKQRITQLTKEKEENAKQIDLKERKIHALEQQVEENQLRISTLEATNSSLTAKVSKLEKDIFDSKQHDCSQSSTTSSTSSGTTTTLSSSTSGLSPSQTSVGTVVASQPSMPQVALTKVTPKMRKVVLSQRITREVTPEVTQPEVVTLVPPVAILSESGESVVPPKVRAPVVAQTVPAQNVLASPSLVASTTSVVNPTVTAVSTPSISVTSAPTTTAPQTPATAIVTATPGTSSAVPPRVPILPTPQQPQASSSKGPPTASIKPLPHKDDQDDQPTPQ